MNALPGGNGWPETRGAKVGQVLGGRSWAPAGWLDRGTTISVSTSRPPQATGPPSRSSPSGARARCRCEARCPQDPCSSNCRPSSAVVRARRRGRSTRRRGRTPLEHFGPGTPTSGPAAWWLWVSKERRWDAAATPGYGPDIGPFGQGCFDRAGRFPRDAAQEQVQRPVPQRGH
jgi:hypothetical protein